MKKLLVIFMVLAFVAPAMAGEWNFYGSARVTSFWYAVDDDASDNSQETFNAVAGNEDVGLKFNLQSNSRIGAKVKATDQVSGRFEYGGSSPGIRLLYGTFNFGPGKLTVGQDYNPSYLGISTSAATVNSVDDNNLLYNGIPYNSRDAQIKLTFGGFQIAFLGLGDPNSFSPYTDRDFIVPRIEMAYTFKTNNITVKPYLGFQTYDLETVAASQDSETVTSYLAGITGKAKFGAFYVNWSAYYAQNADEYGIDVGDGGNAAYGAKLVNGSIEDSTGYGAALVLGFKVNNVLRIEAGYGMVEFEVETASNVDTTDGTTYYYIQFPITLAKGVYIYPEIGVIDDGDLEVDGASDVDEGTVVAYGFKFQINF